MTEYQIDLSQRMIILVDGESRDDDFPISGRLILMNIYYATEFFL